MNKTQPLQIAKCDPKSDSGGFRATYLRKDYIAGCEASYRLGLMDGQEGYVCRPDKTGYYRRVRVRRATQDAGKSPLESCYVEMLYSGKWIRIAKCGNHELALAMYEDVVDLLARAGSRE